MTYSTKSYGVQEVPGEQDARNLLASCFLSFSLAFSSSCFLTVIFSLPVTSYQFLVLLHCFSTFFR